MNFFELFLSAHFLFREILSLNQMFALYVKLKTLLQISSPVSRDRACSVILWSEKSIFVAFNQRAEITRKKNLNLLEVP